MTTLENKTSKAQLALSEFEKLNQEQVDKIVKEITKRTILRREYWAKLAFNETQIGLYEDKIIKNFVAGEGIYHYLRDKKTVGIIKEDEYGYEIASPVGVIAAFLPTTNPTATLIMKVLVACKTRNPIIFSPHPRAIETTVEICNELHDVAVKAGAPVGCIQSLETVSMDLVNGLMKDENVNIIWATGGSALSKAALSSGKPACTGGAGNIPSYIEKTADIKASLYNIIMDKMFDNSSTCTSTKGLIIDEEINAEVEKYLKDWNCYFLTDEEVDKVEATVVNLETGLLNIDYVAASAYKIAQAAGIDIPENTKILIAPMGKVSSKHRPIEAEMITAILKTYIAKTSEEAIYLCDRLMQKGGMGHSANIYTKNNYLLEQFSHKIKAGRISTNMPPTFANATAVYTDRVPTFNLSCGTWGNNSTTDNLQYDKFLNIKRVAKPFETNLEPFTAPKKVLRTSIYDYFNTNKELDKKVLVITDKPITQLPFFAKFITTLKESYKDVEIFDEVTPDPGMDVVLEGVKCAREFSPDTIIAIGGGSPMDLAKLVRVLYDIPTLDLMELCLPFMEISKKLIQIKAEEIKTELICIPTTAGTGSEVTCFVVVSEPETHVKIPTADNKILYADVALLDGSLVETLPSKLVAETGFDALVHAVEAYVSIAARPETDRIALKAIKNIYNNLQKACKGDKKAKANMLYAASDAGIALSNAFVGINHTLGHQLGGAFGVPHGTSLAVFFLDVIKFNSEMPYKFNGIPSYAGIEAPRKYAEIAKAIGIKANTTEEAIALLIKAFEQLLININMPRKISELNIDRKEYESKIDELITNSFCDITLAANPRGVLAKDFRAFFENAYSLEDCKERHLIQDVQRN